MKKGTRNRSDFCLLDKPTTAGQRHFFQDRSEKHYFNSHANSRCRFLTQEQEESIESVCLKTIFNAKGMKDNRRRPQRPPSELLKSKCLKSKKMPEPNSTLDDAKRTQHTVSLFYEFPEKITVDLNSKEPAPLAVSSVRQQEENTIEESLLEIKRERLYHKHFMEYIARRYVQRYPKKFDALRDCNKVEKLYTEVPFADSHKNPTYLNVESSFYSRSRKKCYKELPQEQQDELKRQRKTEQQREKEKTGFSYLKYVADMRTKKQFQNVAKGRQIDNANILTKSKVKILSLWKVGSKNQQVIKDFIDKVLKERRSSLNIGQAQTRG